MENSIFPLYRKRFDGKTFYEVLSTNQFIEYQKVGDKVLRHQIDVVQYPEQLLIKEIISCASEMYIEIERKEFNKNISTKKGV